MNEDRSFGLRPNWESIWGEENVRERGERGMGGETSLPWSVAIPFKRVIPCSKMSDWNFKGGLNRRQLIHQYDLKYMFR